MTIGPVQLLVLGFNEPEFKGEILAELDRLKESDVVRVIDALGIYKDSEGEVSGLRASNISEEHAAEFGAVVGALIGFGAAGEEGAEAGGLVGAAAMEGGVFDEEQIWDVVDEIPENSAAVVMLLEHRWAIPLRDAVYGAGGFPITDGFVHPLDLVAVGLIAREEAARFGTAPDA
jgi:uncharacterized membrane protein